MSLFINQMGILLPIPQDVDMKFKCLPHSRCSIKGTQEVSSCYRALFVQLPTEVLTGRRPVFLYWEASASEQTEGLVRVDKTTRFCQISQPFCGHVFVRGDTKPSQKFPELLQELWPGPEGEA